jgi:hypothetical protein
MDIRQGFIYHFVYRPHGKANKHRKVFEDRVSAFVTALSRSVMVEKGE